MRVPGVRLITVCSIMAAGFEITPAGAENPKSPGLHTPTSALTVLCVDPIIAAPIAILGAADENPGAHVQQQKSQKPKGGAKLRPGTEERLKWGKPVNGLRSALVIRASSDEPKAGDIPDLYLVVQNVSNAPIRFSDTTAAPKLRELYIKLDGRTQAGIVFKDPTLVDIVLQPRDVAFLLMFPLDSKGSDGHTVGSTIAEDALKDTLQTLIAELKIEQAQAGGWTGKLVTGETSGASAACKPQPSGR